MGKLILPGNTSFIASYGMQDTSVFGGAFPAGTPIQDGEPKREVPRSYQIRVGQNLILTPRSEVGNLTPFEVLNYVARTTDLIQIAEFILLNQVSGRSWDVIPADSEDKSNYKKEIKIAVDFLKYPDKERSYSRWLRKAFKNITRYDAFSVYKRRDKKGNLYGLTVLDGALIKPIIDSNGNRPLPPIPAYQQIVYGTPRGEWTTDDLIYAPLSEELVGNYGVGPVERILLATLKYLNKQAYDYAYYNQGSTPDGGLYALKTNDQSQWDPDMIQAFEDNWMINMSDASRRQSLKFVPDGTYVKTKEYTWDMKQEAWFGKLVCTSFGIPQAIFQTTINRATADTEDRQQTELGLQPYITFVEEFFTGVIQNDLGFETLKFKTIDEKLEDEAAKVTKNIQYLTTGIYNRNEIRQDEGKEPIEGGDDYTVVVGNAVIPLDQIGKVPMVAPMPGMQDQQNNPTAGEKPIKSPSNKSPNDKSPKPPTNPGFKGVNAARPPKTNTPVSGGSSGKVASGAGTISKSDKIEDIEEALNDYKRFLIKRFKKGGNLLGYQHIDLPEMLIKTVESELSNVSSIADIFNLFKGGQGSGNFGHSGRPGEVGGSNSSNSSSDSHPDEEDKKEKEVHDSILEWEINEGYDIYSLGKGGQGSGNFGHSGRPGEVGGSGPGGGNEHNPHPGDAGANVNGSPSDPSVGRQGESLNYEDTKGSKATEDHYDDLARHPEDVTTDEEARGLLDYEHNQFKMIPLINKLITKFKTDNPNPSRKEIVEFINSTLR